MNVFDIAGQHAVVVGMGGIGRAIALGLAGHGAHVAVADLDGGRAAAAAREIAKRGVCSLGLSVEVTSEDAVRELAGDVLTVFPRVDILVNAAGVTV